MAKRGAASELNHDNWEEEEETEEAGEFRKASETAMKGRVVRKAKRRNLTEDQKKNVFQGFGGFTSSNQTAEQAFSFLGKKEDKEEATEEKDAKEDEVKEKALGGFSFGSLTGNVGKKEDEVKEKTETKVEEASKTDDLMAKFMTKSSDKWACSVCMVSNPTDKTTCLACETPKPGAAPAGGAPSSDSKPTFNFGGGGGGFKFVDAAASNPESSFGSFKFGASESPAAPAAAGGGFKFGASEPAPAQAGGFKFGASEVPAAVPAAAPEGGGGFKFGASASTSPLAAAASTSPLAASTSPLAAAEPGAGGGFTFASTGKPANQPFTDTPSKGGRKEYLAALKTLNTQVTNWIKSHVDSNPLVDLSPVFADYSRHLQALRVKHDIKAPVTEKKVVHKVTEEVKEAPEEKEASEQKENTEPKPFSFGLSQSSFGAVSSGFGSTAVSSGFGSTAVSSAFGSTVGGFSFGGFAKKEETSKEDGEEGEEEVVKAEEVVEEVEEEGAVYSKKCKLFYKKEEAWVERGLGQLHLKVPEEGKVQVVVRAGTSLGNILLNVLVTGATALERVGKNNLMLVTVPNPPIDPKAEPKPLPFLVRVKTAEDADELKEKLMSLAKAEGKEA